MSSFVAQLRHPRFTADHRYTVRRAPAFAGGELAGRASRRIERHTSVCPVCAELVASLRRTLVGLRELAPRWPLSDSGGSAPAATDPAFIDGILSALAAERSDGRRGPPNGG